MEKPTPAEVRVIFPTSMSDVDLQTIIDDAALVAEKNPATVAASAGFQKTIVKYITAHIASFSGEVVSEKLGDAAKGYAATSGVHLASTRYGQRAILLEPTLSSIGTKPLVFRVL